MQEALLHYIWQFQYFNRENLQTTTGEEISVFNPGQRNNDAGPDFSQARIKIGSIEWIGSVEIHVQSSAWNAHKHSGDDAYENVVLHVVWKNDANIIRKDNTLLPTLELKGRVDEYLLMKYSRLLHNPETIPCASSILHIRELTRLSMQEKALMTRLERKTLSILKMQEQNSGHWEETCYQMLCRNFGFKVNADPFQQLARALPYRLLMKHADKLLQVEALLFGQAGLLEEARAGDEYYSLLKREYDVLGQKYGLLPKRLHASQWKFMRLRPANFPTVRLAQLATLLFQQKNIFSKFIETRSYHDLVAMLSLNQSAYWKRHYQFEKEQSEEIAGFGAMSIENLMINTIVPLMVAYGKSIDDQSLVDNAFTILEKVPAEQNTIIKAWNALGITCRNAFDSQAYIELYNGFCLRRRCLDCSIGTSIVRPVKI